MCLPFVNLPKATHLLLSACNTGGKKSGCHFCELAVLERTWEGAGDDAISRERVWAGGAGGVLGGLVRGRLQGSPAPRQMCLGVTSHLRTNESADRCWESRPGCPASHAKMCRSGTRSGRVAPAGGSEGAAGVHHDGSRFDL